ncbi:unnamed protein product [Acidithrix sp. C25]|nr:unnamed protein product [Acidithrix sp. C25]
MASTLLPQLRNPSWKIAGAIVVNPLDRATIRGRRPLAIPGVQNRGR